MFPLGHIGFSVFLGNLFSLSLPHVAVASLLPDIIDKPLRLLGITTCGRYIGHTLLTGVLISFLVYLFTRKKLLATSILFGFVLHLLEDSRGFVPFFYPFVKYEFLLSPSIPSYNLFAFVTDSIGFILLMYVYHKNPKFRKMLNNILDLKSVYRSILKHINPLKSNKCS